MHLAHLRLRDFRNYPRSDLDFAPGFHVLLGDNAQGKTNILEAIYFLATLIGPHRDELGLSLNDRSAAQFGSEGQKRTLAIALKLARAEYLTGLHGAPPVLLIDDIMGELDRRRRGGFLPLLQQIHQSRGQVFMTATEENWPQELGLEIHRWTVRQGALEG